MSITRAKALDMARAITCEDRNQQYGEPLDLFAKIAGDWSGHLGADVTAADVARMMAMLKRRRIEAAPEHLDSRLDEIAYLAIEIELLGLGAVSAIMED